MSSFVYIVMHMVPIRLWGHSFCAGFAYLLPKKLYIFFFNQRTNNFVNIEPCYCPIYMTVWTTDHTDIHSIYYIGVLDKWYQVQIVKMDMVISSKRLLPLLSVRTYACMYVCMHACMHACIMYSAVHLFMQHNFALKSVGGMAF